MSYLVLVRHGQSQWNLENRFTGWVDIELTELGIEEAGRAGDLLLKSNIKFDVAFTSVLQRAIKTGEIILNKIGQSDIPIHRDQALNERHYGDLQGLNKDDIGRQYGEAQLKIWRRSYDIPPPNGESLKDTQARTMPYYFEYIEPLIKQGKNVFIAAHGNSLRSIVMYLEKMTPEQILETNIPTGVPYIYQMNEKAEVVSKEIVGE